MSRIKLKFVHAFIDRHGKARHYFRRSGFKRIPLPGLPGSAEFMEAYQGALALGNEQPRQTVGAARSVAGTVNAAVVGYYGSMRFANLAERTQRERRRILEHFRLEHGDKRVANLQRQHIEQIVAAKSKTPGAAHNLLAAIRAIVSYAVVIGLRNDNPALGITKPNQRPGGIYTWSEQDITAFEDKHPIGTKARLALGLLLYTAQRRSDVIRMGRQHMRDGIIVVRQQKTGATLAIPVHPELQKILDATPSEHLTFLTTRTARPFTPADFTNWFKAKCREAGLPKQASVHGLRKAACRRLAEAGCSANVIASISGHASLREVERYTKAADQERMARQGIKAISGTKEQQPVANLAEGLPIRDKKS
jgi:integrase